MRTGAHRRRPPLPFGAVLLVLLVAMGAVFSVRMLVQARANAPEAEPTAGGETTSSPDGPSDTPSASPSTAPRSALVVHGTGDVNVDPDYIPNLRTFGHGYAWSGMRGLFRRDDLTIINLECPVSTIGGPVPKEFNFRGDPDALPVMRKAGVEVANLANNHSQDFGAAALLDTRRNLLRARISPVGAGKDASQAEQPALFRLNGWTVAVVGFGGVVPTADWIAGPNHPGMADGDDIGSMVRVVRAAERVADLVFVAIHWGVELDTQPRSEDVKRAHAMIDAGADAIFGGHAHRLQPMGIHKGRPIFYSLGNFVWPSLSVEGSTTAVAEVKVSPRGKVTGRMIPAYIESSGHPVLRGD